MRNQKLMIVMSSNHRKPEGFNPAQELHEKLKKELGELDDKWHIDSAVTSVGACANGVVFYVTTVVLSFGSEVKTPISIPKPPIPIGSIG